MTCVVEGKHFKFRYMFLLLQVINEVQSQLSKLVWIWYEIDPIGQSASKSMNVGLFLYLIQVLKLFLFYF